MPAIKPILSVCAAFVLVGMQTSAPPAGARAWTGRTAEIEAYLRTARIVRTEDTDRGVTRPVHAFLEPGGPVASMTWKAIPPGTSNGFYESYKSEIAAYEIDKLLALGMVPPKVEREVDGKVGVAVMWIDGSRSFAALGGVPKAPPAQAEMWNRELIRAKMFHNLIGDLDPNLGNWLVDADWRVTLIDHSRALTTTTRLVHGMQRIDRPLWERMQSLTADSLTQALSRWLGRLEIQALLARRDRMQKEIDRLLKKKPASLVWVGD